MWKYDLVAPKLQSKAKTQNPKPVTNARNPKPVTNAKPETGYKRETRNRLLPRNPKPGTHSKPERETQDALLQRVMWKYDLVAPKPGDASKLMAQVLHYFTKSLYTLQHPGFHYSLYKILFPTICFAKSCFPLFTSQNHSLLDQILFPTIDFTKPRSTFRNHISYFLLHKILCLKSCTRNPKRETRPAPKPGSEIRTTIPRYPRPQTLKPEHLLITRPA